MPELPEVETIRRGLEARLLGKRLQQVEVHKKRLVRGSVTKLQQVLTGSAFVNIERRGKLLAFVLDDDKTVMLIHLKMTGQLIYQYNDDVIVGGHSWPKVDVLPNKYSWIIFSFTDGSHLYFNDQRQFGYVQLVTTEHKEMIWQTFGPEPLSATFTWEQFTERIKSRRTTIKAALLNQQVIAGIGNIYADEICFAARVKPQRALASLSHTELKNLYQQTKRIMHLAVKHRGTTFSDYRDATGAQGGFAKRLKVYGRNKEQCLQCKQAVIHKITVAGRGTHLCRRCQK